MAKELKELTKRSVNYSEWYNQLVVKADLAEQSDVRGCMVIKPYGYAIWEKIQRVLDDKFKETGVRNAYFPLLIPKSFLSREAEHVEGFAKECAVVTHYRLKTNETHDGVVVDPAARLEEELIIRPTSETIIWNTYRNWIKSYRDLPVRYFEFGTVYRHEMSGVVHGLMRARGFTQDDAHVFCRKDQVVDEVVAILDLADMIMSRSTHVLGNCWREGLVVACVMLAFLGACRVDLLGVGRYVPKADEVETAILTCDYASDSIEIDSPEGIEDVRTLQQNLIAYGGEGDIDTEHAFTIDVTYRLKSGRYVHRTYPVLTNFPVTALGNTQDAQLLREFAQIADSDEGRASRFSEALGLKDNAHVQIEYMREDGTYSSVDLYGKDALDFIQSVLAHDLMEEGAGELFYEMTADESETTYDAVAYVEDQKRSQEEGYGSYLLSLQLSERTPNTLAWLEEHHPEVELIEVSYDG